MIDGGWATPFAPFTMGRPCNYRRLLAWTSMNAIFKQAQLEMSDMGVLGVAED